MEGRMNQYKNKGKDAEAARGKRREFAVSLRKDKRREKLDKRRDLAEFEREAQDYMLNDNEGQAIAALRPRIEDDSNPEGQFQAIVELRRRLAAPKELPIQVTIESGVIPKLVSMLAWTHRTDVQYEVAWILTNISSGKPHQTLAVVQNGAAGPLCHLLASPDAKVKDQACWCLGNIAGDGPELRNMLLEVGALEQFLSMLHTENDVDLLKNVSWTVSNFFRWRSPPAPTNKMVYALTEILRHIMSHISTDPEVLSNECWAVCYIAECAEDLLDHILSSFGPIFIRLLQYPDHEAHLPAIRTLGSITAGTDAQTQRVLELGILELCPKLLASSKVHVRKDVCWTLSNVCAGTEEQITAVLKLNLAQKLIERCHSADVLKVKVDAAWSLCNVISQGTEEQARYVIELGALQAILTVLSPDMGDVKGMIVFLDALERAIEIYDTGAENSVVTTIEEHNGIDKLIALSDEIEHPEIQEKTADLLGFFQEHEEATQAPAIDGNQFAFGPSGDQPPPYSGFNF